MRVLNYFAAAAAIFVAGCATVSEPIGPIDAIALTTLPGAGPDAATVVLARDSGMNSAAVRLNVSVNGTRVGSLMPGDRLRFSTPPGRATVQIDREVVTTWEPNQFVAPETRGPKTTAFPFNQFKPVTLDLYLQAKEQAILRAGFGADPATLSLWRATD